MKIILFVTILLIIFCNNSLASFLISPSHPRILVKSDEITPLRYKCKEVRPFKQVYLALKNRVDGWQSPSANRYLIGYEIQALVFVSLIENYNTIYLEKLDKWINLFFGNQRAVNLALSKDPGTIWGSADIILGLAMAYDWLYSALSPEKRALYGTYLRDFQKAVITEQGGMTRDASRSDYSNQFNYFDGMISVTGISLYKEGIDDQLALTYLKTFDKYVHNHMLPTVNQVGGKNGGWHEGLGYVDRAMTYFTLQLEAWRVGANEDLFPEATGLKGLSKWLLYCTQPDGNLVNIGDVSGWPHRWGQGEGRRAALLALRYRDGFSQYIVKKINPIDSKNWPFVIFYLLWHDPSIIPINPSNIETAMHFDGIGWVSMRNKWEKNATFALFHSGNFYFGHQHLDQNSFIIFKNTPLAIDSGIYNLGTPNYKWATRFHNTILVGDPGPMNSLNDGEAGQTGASPMYFIQNPQKSKSNKGDIILFENHPNYTYTIGDASKAYYPSRLSAFIRKFFFLKPNSFFIFDQIVLPTDHYPIRWLFQSEKMPLISEKLIQVTNGNGHLICKTLLPEKVEISVNTVSFGQTRYGGINYRTEIIPVKRESEEIFLTALWTTDLDPVKIPPFHIIKSQSQNLVGCLISDQLVLFSKNSSAQKREAYFVPMEDSTKLESFIIDLVPKGTYDIYQNGKHILRKASSPGGILQFQTKGGGQFELFLNEVK